MACMKNFLMDGLIPWNCMGVTEMNLMIQHIEKAERLRNYFELKAQNEFGKTG